MMFFAPEIGPAAPTSERLGRAPAECDVLIVEDDEDCREVLNSLLCSEGYRVRTAASGAEALDALAQMAAPPRLVFLDIVMPGMSGFEFLRVMRRAPELADVPVVVHSGVEEQADLATPPGIQGWLQKPVTVDVLLDITRQLVT